LKDSPSHRSLSARLLSLAALLSVNTLAACGGGGGSSSPSNNNNNTISDNSNDESNSGNLEVNSSENTPPEVRNLPGEIYSTENIIGKLFIQDEDPETVEISINTTSEVPVLISNVRELSLDFQNITTENVVGTTHTFIITLTDAYGLQSQETFSVVSVPEPPVDTPSIDIAYSVENSTLDINVNLDASDFDVGEVINGMQFDIVYDPQVITIASGTPISNYFQLVYMNDELSEQGIITVVGVTLQDRPNFNSSVFDLEFTFIEQVSATDISFQNVEVGENAYLDSSVEIVA